LRFKSKIKKKRFGGSKIIHDDTYMIDSADSHVLHLLTLNLVITHATLCEELDRLATQKDNAKFFATLVGSVEWNLSPHRTHGMLLLFIGQRGLGFLTDQFNVFLVPPVVCARHCGAGETT
jgi:hypothetical protein